MNEPIKMVMVSLISLTILLLGILFYRFVYPKKNIHPLILLVFISLLPLISILRPGSYESGDLSEHIKLLMMFYNELTQGNYIPQWTDLGCSGYGCPVFLFMYILPYYIGAIFHIVGFSFVASMKLFLAAAFIISGITIYAWIKDEFGKKAGFIAGIFYIFAPYHLVDLHFRNAVGEIAAFAVLPLCFLFTKKIITEKNNKWILLNAVALDLLILSHLTAAVITLPLLLVYAYIILKTRKKIKRSLLIKLSFSLLIGLLMTCFYWLPIALEGKYIYWGVHNAISFYPLSDLLYSPWRYGLLFQGPHGEHSHLIGYIHLIVISAGLYLLAKNKITRKEDYLTLSFFLFTSLLLFFMIPPYTKPIWESISILKSFQFSYRLLIFINLETAVIASIILKNLSNKKIIIISFLTIMITILNWGNRKAVPTINDNLLHHQAFYTDIVGSPITGPIWMQNKPIYWQERVKDSNKMQILSGKASIKKIRTLSTRREYIVNAQTEVQLKENTFYYPGWKLYVDNREKSINYTNKKYPGLIIFGLKKGLYTVDIVFADTLPRTIGKCISFVSISFLILYEIIQYLSSTRFSRQLS